MENKEAAARVPIVMCLDLDNTLIGDIRFQVCEWDLLRTLEPARIKLFKENLLTQLKTSNLIRPKVKYFLSRMQSKHEQVEFFIFTSSEKRWANFLIPCIEDVLGVSFNRPILTRTNCTVTPKGQLCKSLMRASPIIQKALKRKYPHVSKHDIFKNSVLIDNLNTLVPLESSKLIKCKSYMCSQYSDVIRVLSEETIAANIPKIVIILRRYNLFSSKQMSSEITLPDFRIIYYSDLAKYIQRNVHDRHKCQNDDFWKGITEILQSLQPLQFRDKTVKYINTKLAQSRYGK